MSIGAQYTKRTVMSIFDDDDFGPKNNATVLQLFNAASRNRAEAVNNILTTVDGETYHVDEEVNGISSFLIACKKGHTSVVEVFVKHKSSILESKTSGNLRNGLMLAAFEGHEQTVQYLASFDITKVGTDTAGNNALHYAAWGGHLKIVQYLVNQCSCDVSATNNEGLSAMQFATAGNHVELVKYLTEIAAGADKQDLIAACSESGYNSLHRAAMCGSLDALKLLLSSSSSTPSLVVEAKTVNGSTCLHLASHHGNLEVVTFLVDQHHADVHATNDFGLTPLMFSCIGGHMSLVRFLVLVHGADVRVANAAGANALHLAAGSGRHDICELLCAQATDASLTGGVHDLLTLDAENQSPIDAALASGYKELAAKLALWSAVEMRAQRLVAEGCFRYG